MDQLSEAYEMQPSALPSNTTSGEDQRSKCWEEVKAETGFSTYKSFLEALEEKGLHYVGLLEKLHGYGGRDDRCYSHESSGKIFVVNILSDGSTSISLERQLNTEYTKGPSFEGLMVQTDRKSITSLLQNLRSPPGNVPARIVIWSMSWNSPLCPEAIDALGLGLNIHPSFFEALLSITTPSYESLPSFKPGPMEPSGPGHIRIGDNVATVARNYRPGRRAPSVLIIAGSHNLDYASWSDLDEKNPVWEEAGYHSTVQKFLREEVLRMQISGSASLYRWATEHPRTRMDRPTSGPPNYYLQLFSKYVQKGCSFDSKDITPLSIAMLPLLHLEILRLRAQCGFVRSVMLQVQYGVEFPNKYSDLEKKDCYQVLDKQRFWLRRRLEALEQGKDCFVEFVRSQNVEEWLKSQTWLSQDESIREALAEAQKVDAEVRDYMQLQIGNLSILESRKSIQLSNQQFDEAKRSKQRDSSSSWDILLINPKPKYVGNR